MSLREEEKSYYNSFLNVKYIQLASTFTRKQLKEDQGNSKRHCLIPKRKVSLQYKFVMCTILETASVSILEIFDLDDFTFFLTSVTCGRVSYD